MSMTDPLADMICRIRNGLSAGKYDVTLPSSKIKVAVCKVLKDEGYIASYEIVENDGKKDLKIYMKYFDGKPVISQLKRISTPSCRIYVSGNKLPRVLGGYGISIISTSSGVMTDKMAKTQGIGGEIICTVA